MTKVVLVTGATTGIGYAIAQTLVKDYTVLAGYRKEKDKERLKQLGAIPVKLDVTIERDIEEAVKIVKTSYAQHFYALINNAGIALGGPVELLPISAMKEVFEVNLFGVIRTTQAFIPLLRPQKGRVIMISSVLGSVTMPFVAPYCASKFALEAYSDALRVELKPWGIQVCLVKPGRIRTPIWEKSEQFSKQFENVVDIERFPPYKRAIEKVEQVVRRAARSASPPMKVAKVVKRLLKKRTIPARVLVGWDAKMQVAFLKSLPTRLKDALFYHFLFRS